MASRNPHSGDPRPGTSYASGSKAHSEADRRNVLHHPSAIPAPSDHFTTTDEEHGQRAFRPVYDASIPGRMQLKRPQKEEDRMVVKRGRSDGSLVDATPSSEASLDPRPTKETSMDQRLKKESPMDPRLRNEADLRGIGYERDHDHWRRHPSPTKKPLVPHPLEQQFFSDNGYYSRLYKVVYDRDVHTNEPKSKDFVRRFNGKCGERYKQFEYHDKPRDPRQWYRRVDQAKDLPLPNLIVDDQYTGIPPKREVTISNLNDNVNREFLLKMARNQKLEPADVTVFYHPVTKKHLQMALILFRKSQDARAFVTANNEASVMGLPIGCILDPFAAELSDMYRIATNGAILPPLPHLSAMSEHELSLRREQIIGNRVGVPKTPPAEVEAAPVAPVVPSNQDRERDNRSLSPMDTSNSPGLESMPPPPPFEPPLLPPPPMHAYFDDAGASASKMPSPPPPYSELPPMSHHGSYDERRPESRKRSMEPEGKARREKRRRHSTSSSSSESSPGEGHSNGSRHRNEGGVKRKREEYLKVKRYVSSERDSNGDKRIVKEVKTVTYKRRTEQRITQKDPSPDSFDEEMKRREREMNRGPRTSESRGKDEMRWSTPSSDSDNGREGGGGRRKRGKDRTTKSHSRDDERRPPGDAACSRTPSSASLSTTNTSLPSVPTPTPSSSSRHSRFSAAPVFDPSQPPPLIVPPVGLVLPDCSQPPQMLPPPPQIPLPSMMVPPPPLPGGFIPPPEFFGLQSTPAMMCAASAAAAGMGLPPPPMAPSLCGFGATPLPNFGSPVKIPHAPLPMDAAASRCSLPVVFSSPPPSMRASASSTTTARPPVDLRVNTPTYSDGGSTPRATNAPPSGSAEKKSNLDDRLSLIFGLKKKKEEEASNEIKHAASAPSGISSMAAEQRPRNDDDMEIDDDDDDMDVASSSSEGTRGAPMTMDRRGDAREKRETEEDRRHREREERNRKELQADRITKITMEKLVKDLEQQIARDLHRKLEATAYHTLEAWEKRQKNEEEEKKKQMLRDVMNAAQSASVAAPKKNPMEEMLVAKLRSPEGLQGGGISKVFSCINIVKKKIAMPAFSRDGTPASQDSRAQSRAKSRSASVSRSSTTSTSTDSSSSETDEEEEEGVRRTVNRKNKRNIESSQSSPGSSSSTETNDDSMAEDVDVLGMSEDENEQVKKALEEMKEEEESESASSPRAGPSTPTAAASPLAAGDDKVVKKEEEEEEGAPSTSTAAAAAAHAAVAAPPPAAPSWSSTAPSTTAAARMAAQRELMRLQPSMRVDHDGYHPVRYDHPYVLQLGAPAGTATTAEQRQQLIKNMSPLVIEGGKIPPILTPAASSVQPKPSKTKTDAQRKTEAEKKVPNELRGLLPAPESRKTTKKTEETRERKRRVYGKRASEEEDNIKDSFKAGVDGEDDDYLKRVLEDMQKDGAVPFGKKVEFESRIRTYTPMELKTPAKFGKLDLFYDDPDLAGIVPHPAGCARAQGFYRLTFKQKIRIMRRPEAFQDRTEINERDEVVTRHQVQAQKEQRSMNRRLQTMTDLNPNSEYFKVNQLKYRKKMIKFARSRIHGWGLYALEAIAPDDMIVEYIGQKIRPAVADEREKQYERRGIGSSYLFRIDEDEVIDATKQGNFARFINHSCQPNCYAKVVTVDGDKRIVIYSKSLIQKGDEITYDYKFPIEEDKIDCLCGAPSCRGTLN